MRRSLMASAWRVPPGAPVLVPHTCVGEPKLLHHPVRRRSEARFCTGEVGPVHGSCEGAAQEEEPSSYKWRLLLSYDGTKYAGWQLQQKPVTVQLMLQEALTRITKLSKKTTLLVGASRTDTGVHALGQVAHFYTTFQLQELQSFHDSLNGVLPSDIRIREVAAVQQQFHARHLAKKKTYQYKVYCNPIMDPFQLRYALHVRQSLNINAMREAAKCFVGEHDFTAFANASKQVIKGGFVREIYRFEVTEKDSSLLFEVEGSGFFNKQVRNMVGLLLEIGKEVLPSSAACIILASRCRKLLANYASSAPPHGLYLMRVVYDEADLESPPGSPHNSCGIMQTRSKCKVFLPQLLH